MKILSLNQFNEKIKFQKRKLSDIKNLGDSIIEPIEFPKPGKTLVESLEDKMIAIGFNMFELPQERIPMIYNKNEEIFYYHRDNREWVCDLPKKNHLGNSVMHIEKLFKPNKNVLQDKSNYWDYSEKELIDAINNSTLIWTDNDY